MRIASLFFLTLKTKQKQKISRLEIFFYNFHIQYSSASRRKQVAISQEPLFTAIKIQVKQLFSKITK